MPLAHVGGLPVEEVAIATAPVLGVVGSALRQLLARHRHR